MKKIISEKIVTIVCKIAIPFSVAINVTPVYVNLAKL